MSVYIKWFPLPNNCGACPLRLAWCRERIYMVTRPERCPLVPVPKHGEMTNADRIRSMSDEELAEWFLREPFIGYFAFCPPGTKDGDDCPTSPCEQCWLDWLKSPVEVDNGGN